MENIKKIYVLDYDFRGLFNNDMVHFTVLEWSSCIIISGWVLTWFNGDVLPLRSQWTGTDCPYMNRQTQQPRWPGSWIPSQPQLWLIVLQENINWWIYSQYILCDALLSCFLYILFDINYSHTYDQPWCPKSANVPHLLISCSLTKTF